jgi:peptidoglycan/LPS O-acetylase OafA/YrhL
VWLVVSLVRDLPTWNVFATFAYAATYTLNISIAVGASSAIALGHLWSLGVEEQFYLLWPALLVLLLSRRVRRSRIVLLLAGLVVVLAAVRFALRPDNLTSRFDAGAVTRFDSILVGCCFGIAFASRGQPRVLGFARRPVVWLPAALVCAGLVLGPAGEDLFYNGKSLLFAVASGVVLLAVVQCDDRPTAGAILLASAPVVFIGRISYALYLWHSPILQWTKDADLPASLGQVGARAFALAASVAAATASHLLVERPFLRLKWRLARTPSHDAPFEEGVSSSATASPAPIDAR